MVERESGTKPRYYGNHRRESTTVNSIEENLEKGKVQDLLNSLDKEKYDQEPALRVGIVTGTVAGVLSLITYFFPSLPEKQLEAIFAILIFALPIITAIFTRGKVWSPNSVQLVVTESVNNAIEITKLLTQRKTAMANDEVVEIIE